MDEGGNQREFTRVPIRMHCEVRAEGRLLEVRSTRNLSMKGMLLLTPEVLEEGVPCEVLLRLSEDASVEIRAEGEVVHRYAEGLAIQFSRLVGLDSYEHLRRMVLYNAEDPGQVEVELDAHLGIRKRA